MLTNPTKNSITEQEYKPQLDGLRFVAVFVVIFYHYFPEVHNMTSVFDSSILLAFFFVLSSYLITKVLIKGKEKGSLAGHPTYKIGLFFLLRRTLRIFPAYYFYLFLLFLLPIGGQYLRENLEVFVFYLSNFQLYSDQQWNQLTAHLWTLAVEEQFYLLWPWVILFTPSRYLPVVLYFIVFAGVLSRLILYGLIDYTSVTVSPQVLTPTCLDSFGLGALLAIQHIKGNFKNPILLKMFFISAIIWGVSLSMGYNYVVLVMGRLLISFFAMVVIEGAVNGYQNRLGDLLQHKVVLYLAKISYGIYLYHIFSAVFLWEILIKFRHFALSFLGINIAAFVNFLAIPWMYFSLSVILTIMMAAASWHFLEKPINKLKNYFCYSSSKHPSKVKVRQLVKN